MISQAVIQRTAEYRETFQTGRPFKHVCIDNFFNEDAAENLLRDFPPFDRKFARNEFGEYGGKAVVSEIWGISNFYAEVYRYLMSQEFLSAMSLMTGIEDLHGDPQLYGGGTHENIDGQELDSHVDFNLQIAGGFHRRANLLLYLNKEWSPSWGGAIELHSDPRHPENDKVKEYNVIFNRAVVFETNEHSWHGFRRICLPEDRSQLSRKCLSIYLYTRERPAEEIAGPHGTFYVQRPLPEYFVPGRVLSDTDLIELRAGYARRDRQIEMYQALEEQLGRELEQARSYLNEVLSAVKAPIVGFARQVGDTSGLFHDGWATQEISLQLRAEEQLNWLLVKGHIPKSFPNINRVFEIEVEGEVFRFARDVNGDFGFGVAIEIDAGTTFRLVLRCDSVFNPGAAGQGGDQRDLSYHLHTIDILHSRR